MSSASADASSPGAPLILSTVSEPGALWALKPHWDALWWRAAGHHAQSERSCYHAWQHDRDPSPRRLHAIVGWRGDRLDLLWPLVVRRRHRLWNAVMPLGPDAAESTAMLVAPGASAEADAVEAWHALLRTGRADIVRLPYVRSGTPLHRALLRPESAIAADEPGGRILTAEPDVAPTVSWQGTREWDRYYATLSAASRKVQNRKRRQLSDQGSVTFEVDRAAEGRAERVGWLLEQKRLWARRTGKYGSWLAAPAYDRYLSGLSGDPGADDMVLFTLSLDGTVIAAQLASVGNGHTDWIIAAFDPAWSRFSPGLLLNEHCLRWALERGLRVELGTGNEDNKRFWSRGAADTVVSYRIAGTRRGAAIESLRLAAHGLTTRVRTRPASSAQVLAAKT